MTVKSTGRRPSFIGAVPTCFWAPSISTLRKATLAFFISAISFCSNRLDQPEPISGTVAAAVLQRAQKAGLKTILDLVSEDGDRFTQIVRPALKFCDYCVLNEFEAERTTGIEIVREGRVDFDAARKAAQELLAAGVREWVVIHFPAGAIAVGSSGRELAQACTLSRNSASGQL